MKAISKEIEQSFLNQYREGVDTNSLVASKYLGKVYSAAQADFYTLMVAFGISDEIEFRRLVDIFLETKEKEKFVEEASKYLAYSAYIAGRIFDAFTARKDDIAAVFSGEILAIDTEKGQVIAEFVTASPFNTSVVLRSSGKYVIMPVDKFFSYQIRIVSEETNQKTDSLFELEDLPKKLPTLSQARRILSGIGGDLELQVGEAVEMEHTEDPAIARKIAQDHLDEDPEYYSKLAMVEEDAQRKWDEISGNTAADIEAPQSPADVTASHHLQSGRMKDLFTRLYELHESGMKEDLIFTILFSEGFKYQEVEDILHIAKEAGLSLSSAVLSKIGEPALTLGAAVRGKKYSQVQKLAEQLIEAGEGVDNDPAGISPFMQAVAMGDLTMAKLLYDYGANIDWQDPTTGATPLMFAAGENDMQMVRFLVEEGADLTIEDKWGLNARDMAHTEEFYEVMRYLEKQGLGKGSGWNKMEDVDALDKVLDANSKKPATASKKIVRTRLESSRFFRSAVVQAIKSNSYAGSREEQVKRGEYDDARKKGFSHEEAQKKANKAWELEQIREQEKAFAEAYEREQELNNSKKIQSGAVATEAIDYVEKLINKGYAKSDILTLIKKKYGVDNATAQDTYELGKRVTASVHIKSADEAAVTDAPPMDGDPMYADASAPEALPPPPAGQQSYEGRVLRDIELDGIQHFKRGDKVQILKKNDGIYIKYPDGTEVTKVEPYQIEITSSYTRDRDGQSVGVGEVVSTPEGDEIVEAIEESNGIYLVVTESGTYYPTEVVKVTSQKATPLKQAKSIKSAVKATLVYDEGFFDLNDDTGYGQIMDYEEALAYIKANPQLRISVDGVSLPTIEALQKAMDEPGMVVELLSA